MGEARELMNRITEGVTSGDRQALQAVYAPDAVIETPDAGSITGQDAILEYLLQFGEAFPDASWESLHEHEAGDVIWIGNDARLSGICGTLFARCCFIAICPG